MTSLSARWADTSHRALRGSSDMTQRLAIALTPVRSIIRVIDDGRPAMSVDWSRIGQDDRGKPLARSFTDFARSRIAVNPLPIIENKLPTGSQIDVVTGFAMHEASHAKHSRDRWRFLVKKEYIGHEDQRHEEVPAFKPMRVAAYLFNLVEDVRIEALTSQAWPGFAPYFANLLDWMWNDSIGKAMDDREQLAYGPSVEDKTRIVFMACRFPDRIANLNTPIAENVPAEIEWWRSWQHDYLRDVTDVPTTIQRGLDHLAEDEQTADEMQQMADEEQKAREEGEKIRQQIERLLREGIGDAPGVCVTSEGELRPLTEQEGEQVDRLVKEGLAVVRPTGKGRDQPLMRVRKPLETPDSQRAYVGRPDAATEALRAALVFRGALPAYDLKLQKRGEMDDEEVYRFGLDDHRIFSQRVVETRPDVFMGLLVDLSGSMEWGGKLQNAQRLAQLFLWALHDMTGVRTTIWGHSGDMEHGEGADIYRLWEPGDPMRRLGLISTLPHGNNYDSHVLGWCVNQMLPEPEPQKILVVLSDGLPQGRGYGGDEAMAHVRETVDWSDRAGVTIIQIAIDEYMRAEEQSQMYRHWIEFKDEKRLPRDLTAVLGRFAK